MDEIYEESYFEGEPPHLKKSEDSFGYGTAIRTFSIVNTTTTPLGFEVTLNLDLDSGYELEGAKLMLSHEDLEGYETTDVHQAVTFALGFFEQ
ncbi:hypothetical protein OEV98_08055 [Caldibacillus lycopersici]|uniref:Uncharacterized protein n=1 Tax=Perspicuibacillus lycopersici TaxID=1325689 RepID=A0AAE3LQH6_9BACI|nr:hypothetical protein [Perspicuibacillus lycopersici]MCU9613509.1 hypothetical protein [Perspicuibacillus lycopersici]